MLLSSQRIGASGGGTFSCWCSCHQSMLSNVPIFKTMSLLSSACNICCFHIQTSSLLISQLSLLPLRRKSLICASQRGTSASFHFFFRLHTSASRGRVGTRHEAKVAVPWWEPQKLAVVAGKCRCCRVIECLKCAETHTYAKCDSRVCGWHHVAAATHTRSLTNAISRAGISCRKNYCRSMRSTLVVVLLWRLVNAFWKTTNSFAFDPYCNMKGFDCFVCVFFYFGNTPLSAKAFYARCPRTKHKLSSYCTRRNYETLVLWVLLCLLFEHEFIAYIAVWPLCRHSPSTVRWYSACITTARQGSKRHSTHCSALHGETRHWDWTRGITRPESKVNASLKTFCFFIPATRSLLYSEYNITRPQIDSILDFDIEVYHTLEEVNTSRTRD